ncbi:hypothetical protein BB558_001674 [Smittium angustum]|uniref:DUF4939 domain-containing protein n=1 Tax=Smittium angustum TaxID=133377 RepID=A0A2U1JB51_SMIAN|nr:hypothetical protein BB558_001674 [Smittium angustum]
MSINSLVQLDNRQKLNMEEVGQNITTNTVTSTQVPEINKFLEYRYLKDLEGIKEKTFSNNSIKVGLIISLFQGEDINWESPLLETNSHVLSNIQMFIAESEATFGDPDRVLTTENQIEQLNKVLILLLHIPQYSKNIRLTLSGTTI